ncbi:hypothetical protein QSH57_004561 [Fusarium oxysporum f. sp. vasinfectum]|nr:hypothetical protein QSH57_004561 [Fusarium oxysporum f. sp. vasinfectum]
MRLIIRDDEAEACKYVAHYVVKCINAFQPIPEPPIIPGLPTDSSPIGVYYMLVRKYKAGEVFFGNVVTFNMDEYVGLLRGDPNSYHSFMWKHFFSHVNIHPSNGFKQILPSKVRTGTVTIPETKIQRAKSPASIAPEPIASHLLRATPAGDCSMKTPSPILFPDRMASRIPEPNLNRRLTPNLEVQTSVPKTKVQMIDSAVAMSPDAPVSNLLQPMAANIETM